MIRLLQLAAALALVVRLLAFVGLLLAVRKLVNDHMDRAYAKRYARRLAASDQARVRGNCHLIDRENIRQAS